MNKPSRLLHALRGWSKEFSQPQNLKATGKAVGVGFFKVVNLFCAIHLFTAYVGNISFMNGASMLPTLNDDEIIIEDRISLRLYPENLARGDLVVLKSPYDPTRLICKRVLGLPGDVVCVDPTGTLAPSTEHVVIPKGHMWISGDNAAMSRDSREYGPVSMSLIQSRLYARVWPLKSITIFRNPTTYLE